MPKPTPAPPSKRSTAALITAVAGLISAVAAFTRAPQEPTAKESYTVLQKAFKEQTEEIEQLQKDTQSLRSAFEDYARAKEGKDNVVTDPNGLNVLPPVQIKVTQAAPSSSSTPHKPPKLVILPASRKPPESKPAPLPDFSVVQRNAKK